MAYMAKIEYKNYSHQVGVKEVLRRYWNTLILCSFFCCGIWEGRDQSEVDELVVHLDESLEISSMEQGVKLVGAVLSKKPLNKWGVKNKLGSSPLWKSLQEKFTHAERQMRRAINGLISLSFWIWPEALATYRKPAHCQSRRTTGILMGR
ncbi:unnamed protein product [Malus baccata var. baccata]